MVLVRCPHTGTNMRAAVTSWFMHQQQQQQRTKKITVKTAHIKAKKHTVTPSYIQSPVRAWTQAHTRRDRFTLSAHFSFGRSMRLKIHLDLQSNTVKNFFKNKLEKSRMKSRQSDVHKRFHTDQNS